MRVAIIGAGIIGSAIAFELSCWPGLEVLVLEKNPAQAWGATGAALGVLLGGLSQKLQGKHLELRQASLKRWQTLIPELEKLLGQPLPYNPHGILELCFDSGAWGKWQSLTTKRQEQGFPLKFWSPEQVQTTFPGLATPGLVGGVFSAQDAQVAPIPATQALRAAAQKQGVRFYYQAQLTQLEHHSAQVKAISWQSSDAHNTEPIDYLVIAAGLDSTLITSQLQQPLPLQPVLGQALYYHCSKPMHQAWPVIQGKDVHLVPVLDSADPGQDFWVGATVEFSEDNSTTPPADTVQLQALQEQALRLFPFLNQAELVHAWSGIRPRPVQRSAPIIEPLAPYDNVLLATGHYRNGILLAPITAETIKTLLQAKIAP